MRPNQKKKFPKLQIMFYNRKKVIFDFQKNWQCFKLHQKKKEIYNYLKIDIV